MEGGQETERERERGRRVSPELGDGCAVSREHAVSRVSDIVPQLLVQSLCYHLCCVATGTADDGHCSWMVGGGAGSHWQEGGGCLLLGRLTSCHEDGEEALHDRATYSLNVCVQCIRTIESCEEGGSEGGRK